MVKMITDLTQREHDLLTRRVEALLRKGKGRIEQDKLAHDSQLRDFVWYLQKCGELSLVFDEDHLICGFISPHYQEGW